MKKYNFTFEIFDTEEEAKEFTDYINKNLTYYMRKHHPARMMPYSNEYWQVHNKFIVNYYY